MTEIMPYIVLGVIAGVLSGVSGIGGGIILVPALVMIFGMSQHQAQGTTLALMLPPVGLLAAWTYYTHGLVDLRAAGLIIIGFFLGGWFGGKIAVGLPNDILQKIFAIVLLLAAIKILSGK